MPRALRGMGWLNGPSRKKVSDVRSTFPSADQVGKYTVFNIGGNKYRLITVIHFNQGKIYVRHIMTHKDYARGSWKDE